MLRILQALDVVHNLAPAVNCYDAGLRSAVLILCTLVAPLGAGEQTTFDSKELAEYRLTPRAFEQFQEATRLIALATRDDPRFIEAPLFTHEVAVSGDAPVVAAVLAARLESEPLLAEALRSTKLTARDYTRFALALIAARLAHGFVSAGVIRRVPAGVATDNVKFVDEHQSDVAAVLRAMGVDN